MKNILILVFILLSSLSLSSQLRLGAAVETDLNLVGAKGQVRLGLTDNLGLQGSIVLYISSSVSSMLNFDGQYVLTTAGDADLIKVNAIAGLNYWSSGIDGDEPALGLNIGTNVVFPITNDLEMFIEPKLTIISKASFNVALGMYF